MCMIQLHNKKFKPFITKEEINSAVLKMAEKIQLDYEGMNPVFIGVLNGSFLIVADLVREFTGNCEVSFVKMASYEGINTTGVVNELIGLNHSIENRHVVIIEDIVDSGSNALNTSPVEICTKSYFSFNLSACVPFPAPGGPNNTMFNILLFYSVII